MSNTTEALNLREFKFPKLTPVDLAFSTLHTDPDLLAEARRRGFYNGHTPFNRLFSSLFFKGGKLDVREDVPEDFKNAALPYFKALSSSFSPKHEEKDAICAMLLSELVKTPAAE